MREDMLLDCDMRIVLVHKITSLNVKRALLVDISTIEENCDSDCYFDILVAIIYLGLSLLEHIFAQLILPVISLLF